MKVTIQELIHREGRELGGVDRKVMERRAFKRMLASIHPPQFGMEVWEEDGKRFSRPVLDSVPLVKFNYPAFVGGRKSR